MQFKFFTCVLFFIIFCSTADGQVFNVGNTYFGKDNYIEYFAGNAPIIISVPHGGYLEPAGMPDRNCTDCSYVKDAYTLELSRLIKDKFFERTGCYPHMVYNLLHRKKLDMNRELLSATDSNASLDDYWYDYHLFIDSAKSTISKNYGKGLFVDMHGHGHTKQRIELGYLVSKTTLGLSDSLINLPLYTNFTSIRSLALSNLQSLSHVALLRGPFSMGSLLDNKGFPSVPSSSDPFPVATDDYFNGGYNTVRHGSNSSGQIDAIQFELYSSIRFDSTERKKFADSLVGILINYLDLHYFTNYSTTPCSITSIENINTIELEIYPNPATDLIYIKNASNIKSYSVLGPLGQTIESKRTFYPNEPISLTKSPSGLVYILLFDELNRAYPKKVLKR